MCIWHNNVILSAHSQLHNCELLLKKREDKIKKDWIIFFLPIFLHFPAFSGHKSCNKLGNCLIVNKLFSIFEHFFLALGVAFWNLFWVFGNFRRYLGNFFLKLLLPVFYQQKNNKKLFSNITHCSKCLWQTLVETGSWKSLPLCTKYWNFVALFHIVFNIILVNFSFYFFFG